jgi:hypothetical protein
VFGVRPTGCEDEFGGRSIAATLWNQRSVLGCVVRSLCLEKMPWKEEG